ncbi:hypothetical protein HK104_010020 [Borealophlyctis nickersoniae]|nr:hypothetical protein HK104_010020 [Borealophlyctis nickersoniae]
MYTYPTTPSPPTDRDRDTSAETEDTRNEEEEEEEGEEAVRKGVEKALRIDVKEVKQGEYPIVPASV